MLSVATFAGACAAPGEESEDRAEPLASSSEALVGLPGQVLACSLDKKSCVFAAMPVLWQSDSAFHTYDWTVLPGETFKNPGEKGDAIASNACYDTSIAMITIAAIGAHDPTTVNWSSRTHEFLTMPRVQPVYERATNTVSNFTFSQVQAWMLYIPISNYDGGEAAHGFVTGNAYHFPEFLADLGQVTNLVPAYCNPRLYHSCNHVESTAGVFQFDSTTPDNASSWTNQHFIDQVNAHTMAVIGYHWQGGGPHKVVISGYDLANTEYPLLVNDPRIGQRVAAKIVQGARIPLPPPPGGRPAGPPTAPPCQ